MFKFLAGFFTAVFGAIFLAKWLRHPPETTPDVKEFVYKPPVFSTRADVEQVYGVFQDLLDSHSVVTVSDLMDMSGVIPTYIETKYGWTLSSFREHYSPKVEIVDDGFILRLPSPISLR